MTNIWSSLDNVEAADNDPEGKLIETKNKLRLCQVDLTAASAKVMK